MRLVLPVLIALCIGCGDGDGGGPDAGARDAAAAPDAGDASLADATPDTGASGDGGGSPSHADTYVIRGAGFGDKARPAPLIWDDFEGETSGAPVGGTDPVHGARWGAGSSGGTAPVFGEASPRHARSRLSALHDFSDQYNCSLSQPLAGTPGDRVYLSFWWRYQMTGAEPTNNLKPWIVYDDAGRGILYVGMSVPGDDLRSGGDADGPTQWGSAGQADLDGQWIRWEEELEISSAGAMDGQRHLAVHYASPPRIVAQWSSAAQRTHAGSDWVSIDLGTYQTNDDRSPGAQAQILVDDVYIDTSWARVELGDAADYAACTRREVQVATAWSDTEITVTLNQGAFPSLDGLYLHVVDADREPVHSQPL